MMGAEIRQGDIQNAIKAAQSLGNDMAEKVVRKSVANLLKRTERIAKAKAPVDSGLLRKSIKSRVIRGRREPGVIYGRLGLDSGVVETDSQGRRRRPAKYGVPVHQGHITASGQHIPARPFMRQAVDTLGSSLGANDLSEEIIKEVEKTVKRVSKKR